MTLNDVLLELLTHLRSENKPIMISWDAIQQWPVGTLDTFLDIGILKPAPVAQSIECHGCENHCFMDVITLPGYDHTLTRAFIVCDDMDMQSQMGRVKIPLERLQQWQSSVKQLSYVIAGLLGLKDIITYPVNQSVIRLGMLKGQCGRRWVTLNSSDLSLEINQHAIPIDEILYFDDQQLVIDHACFDDLLNRESFQPGKQYTSSTTQREARKLKTQAMYQDWKDAYLRLRKKHPAKSDSWCSTQIAKLDIAQKRDSETIRHHMKN